MSAASLIPIYAAIAASQMNAMKAIGPIVRVDIDAFSSILKEADAPLLAVADCLLGNYKKYLLNYKGLTFYCKTASEFQVPSNTQIVKCNSISIPYV